MDTADAHELGTHGIRRRAMREHRTGAVDAPRTRESEVNVRRSVIFVILVAGCSWLGSALLRSRAIPAPTPRVSAASRATVNAALILEPTEPPPNAGAAERSDGEEKFTWKVGGPTAEGNFLFADWEPGVHFEGPIYLLSGYGFMLISEGSYRHPKPAYLLGFRKQRKVKVYRSFSEFNRALKEIPRGTTVHHHDKCTAGTAPGVHEATWRKIRRPFKSAHLRFIEDSVMYCYCAEGAAVRPSFPNELTANYQRLSKSVHFLAPLSSP